MRLVRLKSAPIRVEGPWGAVVISQSNNGVWIDVKPDTGAGYKVVDTLRLDEGLFEIKIRRKE